LYQKRLHLATLESIGITAGMRYHTLEAASLCAWHAMPNSILNACLEQVLHCQMVISHAALWLWSQYRRQ
jgi:hypothetical protein